MADMFERAKASVTRAFIESNFGHPDAFWENGNYKTVSPLRDDCNAGSFSIREDGVFHDFATGESGDIITLLSAMNGVTPAQAARSLIGEHTPAPVEREEKAIDDGQQIGLSWMPIPEGKVPQFNTKPDLLTLFHVDGSGAFFVVRYNARDDGKKLIYPVYWTGSTFRKGLPEDLKQHRPLLQFDRSKRVIIVEGEKNASDGEKFMPQYTWTTWHGGAPAVKKADFSDLAGCDVVIWPDLDEPGETAADYLCGRLADIAGTLARVVPPLGKDKGWDVSDAIAERYDIEGLIDSAILIDDTGIRADINTVVEPRMAADRAYTDLGNSERFVDMWGHVLRYNVDKGRWLVWLEGRWHDEDQTIITPMLKRTVRNIALLGTGKEALFWGRKSESAKSVSAIMSMSRVEPGIQVSEVDLDQHMYYLNCPNGVVDLRSGVIMPPKPEWLCYKTTNFNYNPKAGCPRFLRFLDETFDDPGTINFVQRWLGYSLTSDVSAQTFAVFYGIGANGKSTLVETMQRVAGDYVKTAPPDTFIQKPAGGVPNDIAALRGARMVLATETEANAKLAEAKVKSMTGGDRVSARYMRGEFFEFTPTWKITISTNHRPRISGGDYGIWRRVVLVPFNNVVTPDRQDPLLPNKLLEEAEGILQWCVKGAIAWYSDHGGRVGLQVPESVYAETQEYREDEDTIGRFIATGCYPQDEVMTMLSSGQLIRGGSPSSHVFYSFRRWAEKEGEDAYARMSQNFFSRAMRERGYVVERTNSERYYPGIVPKPEYAQTAGYN
jgi:putative DNA primase/helicase